METNLGRGGVSVGHPREGVLVLVARSFNWCDCVPMLRDAFACGLLPLVTRRS